LLSNSNQFAKGVQSIRALSPKSDVSIAVNPSGYAKAAAEGSYLAAYSYNANKMPGSQAGKANISLWESDTNVEKAWSEGKTMAEAQNVSRKLQDSPANIVTPTYFATYAFKSLSPYKNVTVNIHDREWAVKQKMGAFLSVARGSDEPLKFVEIVYKGAPETSSKSAPIALVGKGCK
jgi:cytosol aminopeptidase